MNQYWNRLAFKMTSPLYRF